MNVKMKVEQASDRLLLVVEGQKDELKRLAFLDMFKGKKMKKEVS